VTEVAETINSDTTPASQHERTYVVLERQTLAEAIDGLFPEEFPALSAEAIAVLERATVYTVVAMVSARNTEHASRLAGPHANAPDLPVLVPVAKKMWVPRRQPIDREPRAGRPELVG
jgi:hypothetical protein